MNDTHEIYDTKLPRTPERNCYEIFNLCRVGIAATDSALNIDLVNKGGYDALLEAIAELAADAIDKLEIAEAEARRAQSKAA